MSGHTTLFPSLKYYRELAKGNITIKEFSELDLSSIKEELGERNDLDTSKKENK